MKAYERNRAVGLLAVIFMLLVISPLMGGCAQYDAFVATAKDIAGRGMDRALTASEHTICNNASVGSVKRRYGGDPRRMSAWRTLCEDQASIFGEADGQ